MTKEDEQPKEDERQRQLLRELDAMRVCLEHLTPLDEAACKRVLRYVASLCGLSVLFATEDGQ